MDEQLLRARLAALEMAQMQYGFTTDGYVDGVLSVADAYEAWLTRPTASAPAVTHDAETTADLRRADYGAFLRPTWYTDAMQAKAPWSVCDGKHTPGSGWHIGPEKPATKDDFAEYESFASHHYIQGAGGRQCSCGAYEFPCPDASYTDMRT